MYLGNVMLLILNLPLVGLFIQILRIPYPVLAPLILLFCLVGAYSTSSQVADVLVMVVFGLLGYLMRKFKFEAAPLILALILGKPMEESLRQALGISQGSFAIFVTHPISLALLLVTAVSLAGPAIAWAWRRRRTADRIGRPEPGSRFTAKAPPKSGSAKDAKENQCRNRCGRPRKNGKCPGRSVSFALLFLAGYANVLHSAELSSDAPEYPRDSTVPLKAADSYEHAVHIWKTPEDINAWIAANFSYDMARAMRLSEPREQRTSSSRSTTP